MLTHIALFFAHPQAFTPSARSVPPAALEPTIYSSLINQASFHVVGNQCYNRIISSPPPTSEEILALDSQLQIWHSSLPHWFQPSRYSAKDYPSLNFAAQKLFWRYCNLRIILYRRPFIERALRGLPLWSGITEGTVPQPTTTLEYEAQCAELCLQSA